MARNVLEVEPVGTGPTTLSDASYSSYTLIGDAYYDAGGWASAVAFVTVHQTPSGTSPTLDVKMQDSPDHTNWVDSGYAVTQFSGTASAQATTKRFTATTFGRYIRFLALVGGSSTPTYTATIQVAPKE